MGTDRLYTSSIMPSFHVTRLFSEYWFMVDPYILPSRWGRLLRRARDAYMDSPDSLYFLELDTFLKTFRP